MKKVLSLLGLIAILSMLSPVYARGHGEVIHAGPGMHKHMHPHRGCYTPPSHRHYKCPSVNSRVSVRRNYWGPTCCGCRLGWCDYYTPQYGSSIYIRF